MRTHCVVACAAALMMLVSKYGFSDLQIGTQGASVYDVYIEKTTTAAITPL